MNNVSSMIDYIYIKCNLALGHAGTISHAVVKVPSNSGPWKNSRIVHAGTIIYAIVKVSSSSGSLEDGNNRLIAAVSVETENNNLNGCII